MKPHHLFASIATAALLATAPASAASITVLGGGLAEDCYHAAESPETHLQSIAVCTSALHDEALTIDNRAATLVNRGILYVHKGDLDSGIADYDAALKVKPDLAEAYVDRGAALTLQKHYNAALADFDKGLALGPREPEIAHYNRAYVREVMGNIRGAYLDYKKAVELVPDFQLAITQLHRFRVIRKPEATNGI